MATRLAAALALGGLSVGHPLWAATLTTAPTADTYFETYGSEDRNFGAEPLLRIDQWGGRQAMLRFPLAEIPRGKRILEATLRLYVTEIGFNEQGEFPDLKTGVALYDLVTPWTEEGASYKTCDGTTPWSQGPGLPGGKYGDVGPLPKPDIGVNLSEPLIALDPRRVTKDSWLNVDITRFLRSRARAGEAEVNLLLKTSVLARNYTFRSREAAEADQRPHLAVVVADEEPDLALEDVFLTDWQPRQPVPVRVRSLGDKPVAASDLLWDFTRVPAPVRRPMELLSPATEGVALTTALAGVYRLEGTRLVARERGAESPWRDTETATLHLLSVPPHPRLYVTPERLAALRQQAKAGARLFTAFKARVDSGNGGVEKGQYHDFGPPEGCEDNALMYLLTEDPKYAENSITYGKVILQKPMREHFHDVHEATFTGAGWVHAMALHYDWCYDRLTTEQRTAVAEWLKEAASWGWVRSGRPVAHNDGGGRQLVLDGAALALLGDDPEAPEYFRRAQRNFDEYLLPWLNDAGRGGRSGDGGEYEGLHSFFIVRHAWMTHTATGYDVFSESPFFRNRINHILFGWYPRRLYERNGSYSIRTYYSPGGDHIRLGYVGDTQPYQSAAALCGRYRDTPEAQGLRWLAGEWPTEWMQYCLKWAVLGDFESIPAKEPSGLSYFDEGFQTVYMRSDWSDDATWVLFENGPYTSVHQSLDKGGFEIFKGDLLAARTGNLDHGNVGASHPMNYLHRTISTNGLLINDPEEKWKGFLAGAEGASDGGGERTNFPLTSTPDAETYLTYRPVFQRGEVTRFADTPELTYALADLTDAYNSPQFHGGTVNRAKVTSVTRQLLYLRGLDSVVVFDRVSSTDPTYKKTWLLHSLGELDVLDGQETKIDDGGFRYTGATKAVIRYGWPKPVESFARCLSVTLLPEGAQVTKIGGRVDLPPGQTESFPGDQWHGRHRHRHLKDFWVNGVNYPPGNPPETRWFGDPATEWYVSGTPDETGGRGRWRIEVSPPTPAQDDVFFHVLCPRLGSDGPFPEVKRLPAPPFEGALITEGDQRVAVFFSRTEQRLASFSATLPEGKWLVVVTDMEEGEYQVTAGGEARQVKVGADGLLAKGPVGGSVKADRK